MPFLDFLYAPLIILLVIVAPVWIITHYVTRWRTSKTLSTGDEKLLAELWESASKMEDRINNIERILDDEMPEGRNGK